MTLLVWFVQFQMREINLFLFIFICWFHGKKEMIMFLVGLEQEGGCKEGGDGRNTMKSQFTNQWNQQNNKVKCSPIIIA
jgi:hypothetical protein